MNNTQEYSVSEDSDGLIRRIDSAVREQNLKSIGAYAFSDCESLTSITIPDGVTSIGEEAFIQTGLQFLTIPGSVKNLGAGVVGTPIKTVVIKGNAPKTENGAAPFANEDGSIPKDLKVYVPSGASGYNKAPWTSYTIIYAKPAGGSTAQGNTAQNAGTVQGDTPKTGDESSLSMWIVLMAISAAGLALAVPKRRRSGR